MGLEVEAITGLRAILHEVSYSHVVIVGLCTDGFVGSTCAV